ncbi:OLC1v1034902C1 [Oldenlandia corymbosa var. corymbosa]|uniref:OLC1v1034902C1 n=1 Tax=Oldenlandia corymbosa var. corymbosa TaxID=529605 RepID=A0AAV1CSE8_OLDCO|nr:OLC1v1034902C1 [Oldenlandia corymbosa var. corymbosa]
MAEEDKKQQADKSGEEAPPQRFAGPGSFGGMGGSTAGPKKTWPELVGLTSEEAERRIKEEKPGANVQIVPEGCFVTMDYRTNRVRIFTGSDGKVVRAPMIG